MPEQQPASEASNAARTQRANPAPAGVGASAAEVESAAPDDHVLLISRFPDLTSALYVYDDLRDAEIDHSIHIDGVLVVVADKSGRLRVHKMTDHSTRTGLKWGLVGGAVAAIFLPVTIVGGAVAVGVAGAAAGKARKRAHRAQIESELTPVIKPGTCGLLCLAAADAEDVVTGSMIGALEVKRIPVDAETAKELKAAAAVAAATETPKAEHHVAGRW